MRVRQLTAPACWASYLINGDASSLEPDEQAAADRWADALSDGSWFVVSCADERFSHTHDAWQFSPYAGDVATYTLHGETSYGYGSGLIGCLFDSGPNYAGTSKTQACVAALFVFADDLSQDEYEVAMADLVAHGTHYFPTERQGELGAQLVQIFEWDDETPGDDD